MLINKIINVLNSELFNGFHLKFIIFFIISINFNQTDAIPCVLRNGKKGECMNLKDCRYTLNLEKNYVNFEYCNFEERSVCCSESIGQIEKILHDNQRQPINLNSGRFRQRETFKDLKLNLSDGILSNPDLERVKHSVKKTEYNPVDDFTEDEVPNYDSEEEVQNFDAEDRHRLKNFRRPNGPNKHHPNYFIPPGLEKKRNYENEFFYEYVPKKPLRGPNYKRPNKFDDHPYNRPKWVEQETTKRNDWFHSEETTENIYGWYDQNSNPNSGFNRKTTTSFYELDYTTRRNQNTGNRPNSRPENKPFKRPGQKPNFSELPGHQYEQTSRRPPQTSTIKNQYGSQSQESTNFNNKPGSTGRLRISELKCIEYSREVTKNITGLPLTTNPDPVIISVRKCTHPQQLIVGGENTTLGEFPHMAAIGYRDSKGQGIAWNCGGTLISELYVMTAAHCTSTHWGKPLRVRLGEYNLRKNDDGAHPVDYSIAEIIPHPQYKQPSKYNDIALLKLSRRVIFFEHIRPACLYSANSFAVSQAVATGWGSLAFAGNVSDVLQKVVLSIVDNSICNNLYKHNVKTEMLSRGIIDTQLCAGELSGGKDTCQGDSGGPLSITHTKCIHHIIGITSFGRNCALPNLTGVYTRVSAYVPWIESIVWPNN